MVNFDPFSPEALADPYPMYAALRGTRPLIFSERLRSWVALSYADVRQFFTDKTLSADRTAADKFRGQRAAFRTLGSEPPEHTPVRATVTGALYPMLTTLLPTIEGLVGQMTDRLEAATERFLDEHGLGREADLIDDFAYPLPIAVIAELFAVPEAERDQFQQWSHDMARSMDHFYAKDRRAGFADFHTYFAQLVAARRTEPGDDLVSRMLAVDWRGERLTDEEIISLCTTLIFAGHETTTNLIGNGMRALLGDRQQFERLAADPAGLAETAVEELLRFDSPAQMISRTVVAPTVMGGAELQPGQTVLGVIGSANRDEAEFGPTADRLDIGRRPNYHLAFGLGHHFCPGAKLSRLEARAALPVLLRRFPNLRLGDTPGRYRDTAVLRGLETLPVRAG